MRRADLRLAIAAPGKLTAAQAKRKATEALRDIARMRANPTGPHEHEPAYQLGWAIGTLRIIAGDDSIV